MSDSDRGPTARTPGSAGPAADATTVFPAGLFPRADQGISDTGIGDVPAEGLNGLESLPADSALLVVKRGPNAGSRFALDKDLISAGRHPQSDIFLDDVTVSRRHAEFRRTSGGFEVSDVGSLNGTYVNREPIESSSLASGDEVQIGKFRLVFLTGNQSEGARSS